VNGDGTADLAVANSLSNTVSVVWSSAAGTFGSRVEYAAGTDPRAVALADLDGDGRRDLVVANGHSSSVTVYLGTGAGAFGPRNDFPAGRIPSSLAIGDLDGDGHPDLALADEGLDAVAVLLGDGRGGFLEPVEFHAGSRTRDVAIGDVDGDGAPDLVAANYGDNAVTVLLAANRGDPSRIDPQLAAEATPEGVLLRWSVSAAELERLACIRVQRADSPASGFVDRGAAPLPRAASHPSLGRPPPATSLPPASMSFEDPDVEPSRTYWYRLVLRSSDGATWMRGPTGVRTGDRLAAHAQLLPPIEPRDGGPVRIRYRLAGTPGAVLPVRLGIYDVRGRRVRLLEEGRHPAGESLELWDRRDDAGRGAARGLYIVRLESGPVQLSRKLVLLHE